MRKKIRLSQSEMIGFIVLIIVITLTTIIIHYRDFLFTQDRTTATLSPQEIKEIESFSQQITEDSIRKEKSFHKIKHVERTIKPFTFDPNTADSVTLIKIGLQNWQISNMIKYRKRGGKWKNADDFARLYGLSKEEFNMLKPYIKIRKNEKEIVQEHCKAIRDSLHRTYPKKYKEGTTLSLNEADTTALKGIPGIGRYYAEKICRYRERLGGFIEISQLKEIEGLPEDIERWFTLPEKPQIHQIRINATDFKGLVRHPYLNFEQVKAISNYIRKYGKLSNWEELSNDKNFTQKDFQRLAPYFTFE